MSGGQKMRAVAISGGLLVVAVGAFVLGRGLSAAIQPLPEVIVEAAPGPAMPKPAMPVQTDSATAPQTARLGQETGARPLPAPIGVEETPAHGSMEKGVALVRAPDAAQRPAPAAPLATPPPQPTTQPLEMATLAAPLQAAAVIEPEAVEARRGQARQDATEHWRLAKAAPAPAAAVAAEPAPVMTTPVSPPAAAPAAPEPAARQLGFLAEIKDLPEAIAAIDALRRDPNAGDASVALDRLVPAVIDNRSDPMTWSQLAASLARAGQRKAAIAVANRGLGAAKRQQDGEAVTQLTQQLAQLELAGGVAAAPVAPSSARKLSTPGRAAPAAARPAETSETGLAAALEVALHNSAANDALSILKQMAEGSIKRGDFAGAQKSYGDAIQIAHAMQLSEARADQYANLGGLHWKKGDKAEAEAFWRAARDQYEQFNVPAKVADMNALLRQSSPAALSSPSRPIQNGKKTSSFIHAQ